MGGFGIPEILLFILFLVLVFLAVRAVLLWYWKVYDLLENQNKQIEIMQHQSQLIEEQNQILREMRGIIIQPVNLNVP